MVWQKNYGSDDEASKDLVWDLRQIYANKIVGITLEQIKLARDTSNFPVWFSLIKRDLFVETNHKMKKKERIAIKEKIEVLKKLINENKNTFLGKDSNALSYQKIDEALCELEMMFWIIMEDHNMLGKPEGDEGLF